MFAVAEVAVLYLNEASLFPRETENRKPLIKVSFPAFSFIAFILLSVFLLGKYSEGSVSKGGGLMKPTLFRFDFSKYLKLESEISMQDDLVLLFRQNKPENYLLPEHLLLRRFVLSGYRKGRGFFAEPEPSGRIEPSTVPDYPVSFADPAYIDRTGVSQDFFLVNLDPEALVAMNYPVSVTPYKNWNASSFMRIYNVRSMVQSLFPTLN